MINRLPNCIAWAKNISIPAENSIEQYVRDDKTRSRLCSSDFQTPLGKCKHHYHLPGKFPPSPFSLGVSFILFSHNFTFSFLFLNYQTVLCPLFCFPSLLGWCSPFSQIVLKSHSSEHLLSYLTNLTFLEITSSPALHKVVPEANTFVWCVTPSPHPVVSLIGYWHSWAISLFPENWKAIP